MTVILRAFSRVSAPSRDAIVIDFGWRTIERWGVAAQVGPSRFAVVATLIAARTVVSLRDLGEALCADREDGGPFDPRANAATHIWRAREALAPLGVLIRGERHGWYEAQFLPRPASEAEVEGSKSHPGNLAVGRARRRLNADSAQSRPVITVSS